MGRLGPCHGGLGSFKRFHLYQFSLPLSLPVPLSVSVSLGLPVVVTVWQLCAGQITWSLWSVSQLTIVANEGSRRAQRLAYTATPPLPSLPSPLLYHPFLHPLLSLPFSSYIHPLHPPCISLLHAPSSYFVSDTCISTPIFLFIYLFFRHLQLFKTLSPNSKNQVNWYLITTEFGLNMWIVIFCEFYLCPDRKSSHIIGVKPL